MKAVYLTAQQVADRLQVSVSWVYKHKYLLGGIRVGGRMWRFPEEGLRADVVRRKPPDNRRPSPAPDERTDGGHWRLTY
jgi:hypothetical protein